MRTVVLALLLAGCAAPKWYKAGAGQRDFAMDRGQCSAQAGSISNPQPFQEAMVFHSCMEGKGWARH